MRTILIEILVFIRICRDLVARSYDLSIFMRVVTLLEPFLSPRFLCRVYRKSRDFQDYPLRTSLFGDFRCQLTLHLTLEFGFRRFLGKKALFDFALYLTFLSSNLKFG